MISDIIHSYHSILSAIQRFEQKYHRPQNSVQLLAASKGQSLDKLKVLAKAGHLHFGENYLQEAVKKISAISSKTLIWHYIGTLQSNKISVIAHYFSWVHSIVNIEMAQKLNEVRSPSLPPLNICIQVNIDNSATKHGIRPDLKLILNLAKQLCLLPRLKLRGLMAIPKPQESFDQQRKPYRELFSIYQSIQKHLPLDTLSAGMSQDMEAAIAEGANLIRIGTALFGKRISSKK